VIFGESSWLLLLATVPPAFGAAFYGIANHGEFSRSADRSLAMARELEAIRSAGLDKALASPHETFAALRQTAEKLASVMIAETMDWSFVFRYRTLNLPG
jgi:plasmid maintenance system killer protein